MRRHTRSLCAWSSDVCSSDLLLAGAGPDGLAVLRFRPSIWSEALECYLAELYVMPAQRGRGLGRALMNAAMDLARETGADRSEERHVGKECGARWWACDERRS